VKVYWLYISFFSLQFRQWCVCEVRLRPKK